MNELGLGIIVSIKDAFSQNAMRIQAFMQSLDATRGGGQRADDAQSGPHPEGNDDDRGGTGHAGCSRRSGRLDRCHQSGSMTET